jgi:GGDEF domain-containing protein/EAL domain-containing protein (putative c-di-GMP-specific phosphodiesterase class I)
MRLPLRGVALVVGLLLLSCAWLALQAWTLAQGLQAEQAVRNAQAAQLLAASWLQPEIDARRLPALAAARFAQGQEVHITVRSAEGRVLVLLNRAPASAGVPGWWAQAWPLTAPPGRTAQATGNGLPAVVEAEASPAWAQQLLWQTASRSALLLACVASAAGLWAAAMRRRGSLPLWLMPAGPQTQAAAPAAAFDASGLPALHSLAQDLEATVRGLRRDLALQAEQVLSLQRRARTDTLTGMSLRHHFLGQLQGRLSGMPAGRTALLIVRVCDLDALNQRAGHEATDRLLCAVAQVLLTYVDRVAGAAAGRLNGSDFALCLPVGGVALETALSLREALSALTALRSAGALVVVGGVDELPATTCGAALAEADAALARAEAGSDLEAAGVAVDRHGDLVADAAGASAWRLQISLALSQGRGRLAEVPVSNRHGELVHLSCSLHLQLTPAAAYQPPRSWLALARRARLLPHVDLLTLQLALQAMAADGLPRSVHIGVAAWAAPSFVAAVRALLQSVPAQARTLSIELAEAEQGGQPEALAAAVASWLPSGACLGVAHGRALQRDLTALQAAGMAFVTLSGEQLRGVAADAALQAYAQGLIQWVRELGLSVRVDRVADAQDLDALWALGLDGAAAPPLSRP